MPFLSFSALLLAVCFQFRNISKKNLNPEFSYPNTQKHPKNTGVEIKESNFYNNAAQPKPSIFKALNKIAINRIRISDSICSSAASAQTRYSTYLSVQTIKIKSGYKLV